MQLNSELHQSNKHYGTAAKHRKKEIVDFCKKVGNREILDYGCGKGMLKQVLGSKYVVHEFDPAIPGKDQLNPRKYPVVVCVDVMEHVEPVYIQEVLFHLKELTESGIYFAISLKRGTRRMADGSFAHKSVFNAAWWFEVLSAHFTPEEGQLVHMHNDQEFIFHWIRDISQGLANEDTDQFGV